MAQKAAKKTAVEAKGTSVWVYILVAAVPILLIVLYYISIGKKDIMNWVNTYITAPYRDGAAHVTAFGPFKFFSLAEIIASLLVLLLVFYIFKTIFCLIFREHKLLVLGRRLFTLAVVALYLFAAYSWLWGAVYRTTDLAEATGIGRAGVTVQQLTDATKAYAQKANALSVQVKRDKDGHFSEDREYTFGLSKGVYTNIAARYPTLKGTVYAPKAMIYSGLMSAVGFTGIYIALTGETNVNAETPASLLPVTIAHEMAHQRGVASEEEANFAGIAACVTSKITVYEYSGYLQGLIYLADALNKADATACGQILSTLTQEVKTDWKDNDDFWVKHQTPAAATVSAIYDGYLKSNGQELGIRSYGACVDMLTAWHTSPDAPKV